MRLYFRFKVTTLCIVTYIYDVQSVVHDYCLSPLNNSDCGSKPVPVFTYWKPGSRCELDLWRGCPTLNKFVNQYECHNLCIFRWNNTLIKESEKEEGMVNYHVCTEILNQKVCKDTTEMVYTYEDGVCVQKEWKGCKTANSFATQEECETHCHVSLPNFLENIDVQQLKQIEEILDVLHNYEEKTEEKIETEEGEEISDKSEESNDLSDDRSSLNENPGITKLKLKEEEVETTTSEDDNIDMSVTKENRDSSAEEDNGDKIAQEENGGTTAQEDNGDTTATDENENDDDEDEEFSSEEVTKPMPFIMTPRG